MRPSHVLASTDPEAISVTGSQPVGNSAISPGTRRHSTTQVTIVSNAELMATGQTNLTQALAQMSPSISSPPQPGTGPDAFVQTMQLRGLSADQTLILVDGHRRHISAAFNPNPGPNWGTEPTDIGLIPISAVDHVEIVTEGASALYGQDAIAGAVNIVLRRDTKGGQVNFKNSGYYAGDGQALDGSASYGMALGHSGGYLDLAAQVTHQLPTNRSGLYNGTMYHALPDGSPDPRDATASRDVQRSLGLSKTTQEDLSANMELPLTNSISLYSTDTYSHRRLNAAENYRSAADDLTVDALWPNGMLPYLKLNENDFEVNNGFRGRTLGFSWDSYINYAKDHQTYHMQGTNNASLGTASPTTFYTGKAVSSQLSTGFKASRNFETGVLPKPLGLEFGAEYRRDGFQMGAGDEASWTDGGVPILTGPDAGKAATPGAADHAGNPPLSVTSQNRDVYDGHMNLDLFLTKKWEWTFGGRAVSYNNLATVMTGSVGTRYNVSHRFALRASVNTGYRPPTLGQTYYFYSSPSPTYTTVQIPTNSSAAQALGAGKLKGEYSRSYSIGLDATPVDNFHVTGNLYYIAINDRLASTSTLGGSAVQALLANSGLGNATYATYYTNPVNTNTFGGDLTADYTLSTQRYGRFVFSFGVNITDNEIRSYNKVPSVLKQLGLSYFNAYAKEILLHSSPKNRENLAVNWNYGKWSLFVQESRYGSLVYVATPSTPTSLWAKQSPAFVTNIELGYHIFPRWSVAIGANNLGNEYPTRVNKKAIASQFNAMVYSPYSPYGSNGGMYYVRTSLGF
ncbi:TonB-dependent receptor plug domain-containing protein [Acetobacter sp. LMG 1636]|uniref:TonB-dependent receptor plug domain-containing protein n=2 Tax=Acetobacter fallax TaxID=1737473 RepID=A0ABX0KA85_9PROT|nr:TonB-dependent receptor [Acetobacter fallax]NHO32339.1 TonB-dependent receptor plug domain-containing protein [Acetobacter fallax]NHO35898.1 TonB-dependent receptor plug domain-containing protein [Acetobacter fallax]